MQNPRMPNSKSNCAKVLQAASIKVVGAGGIGSWLLAFLGRTSRIGADGQASATCFEKDEAEEKNLSRQPFSKRDVGRNKAEALAGWLYDLIDITAVEEYVKEDNVDQFIHNLDTVFVCVDNHTSRKIISDHCSTLRDIILISGGNELWDGTVQVYVRLDGKDITPPLTYGHPEIEEPTDEGPWNCAEVSDVEPQIAATNIMVAAYMIAAYWMLGTDKMWHEVHFDIKEGKASSFDFWEDIREKVVA